MLRNPVFGELVTLITSHGSLRHLSRLTGVSHTTIHDWQRGGIPRPEMLAQFATRMGVDSQVRSKLFELAGVTDPEKNPHSSDVISVPTDYLATLTRRCIPEPLLDVCEKAVGLPKEDVALVCAMLDALLTERRKARDMD